MYGDLVAVENDESILGSIISRVTNSSITHAGMMLYGNQFIEASLTGVRISTLEKLANKDYYICELKPEHRKKIFSNKKLINDFIKEQLHRPYDFIGLGKIGLHFISFGLYTPKERNKFFICSELVSKIYQIATIIININTSATSPADLFELRIFRNREKFTRREK
jgi:uncharacterized protein YycO